ncbi:hypothetical protein SteCoe_15202 [Stentor coeruleus]|uniref:DOMON domain-containing protein n=1 Tax=Stentor coeruleus TaxID=5963 RepID=A0A1R2C441_9CILI|nr:hypothetical protein SteCoe_15202 [Stentor coeruleus]
MKLALFLSLLVICLSDGVVHLPNSVKLTWEFLNEERVRFTYSLPGDIFEDFDWGGIGFKEVTDIGGMGGADIVNFIFEDPAADCYAFESGAPDYDVEIGGTKDLLNPFVFVLPDGVKSQWERKLKTDDIYDKQFVKGETYRLLWAFGKKNNLTGEQLQHADDTRGTLDIIFTDDFYNDELLGVVLSLDRLTNQA